MNEPTPPHAEKDDRIRALTELLASAIALAEHGDYKNGNTHPDFPGGIDEGEVNACHWLRDIKAKAAQLTTPPEPPPPANAQEPVITCVYCGIEYPQGTPTHGAQVLTDHIKICSKHPMKKLRDSLVRLVGADGKEELTQMESMMRLMPAPDADKAASINAIHALLETLP